MTALVAVTAPGDQLARRLTCHHCGSDRLELVEITEEHHHWGDGLMVVGDEIQPIGEAVHETGELLSAKSRIRCFCCKREWHPRRRVGMPFEGDAA